MSSLAVLDSSAETQSSNPFTKPAVNVNKQESRQLYVLEKNREQLEKELARLQAEIIDLVGTGS